MNDFLSFVLENIIFFQFRKAYPENNLDFRNSMFTDQTGSCLVDFKTSLGFENLKKHSSYQNKPQKPLAP